MKKFEKGKTYYTWTRKGELRLFKVTAISKNGKSLKGIFNGGSEKIYRIENVYDCIADELEGKEPTNQRIIPDQRYSIVVTADEYKIKGEAK